MTSERCPSCGGAVRPGAPWCTCCWADLRPKPAPPPPPPPPPPALTVPAAAPVAVPAGVTGAVPAAAGWPGATGDVPLGVAAASLLTSPGMLSAPPTLPGALPAATADPLTAPLGALVGQPVAGEPQAPPAVTWPCVECGEANHIDLNACGVCTAPFGGRIARLADVKGARRRYMLMCIGGVGAFLMLLGALTFATTGASTVEDSVPSDPALENPIDYSSLPEG